MAPQLAKFATCSSNFVVIISHLFHDCLKITATESIQLVPLSLQINARCLYCETTQKREIFRHFVAKQISPEELRTSLHGTYLLT
jgi:hypothetical protein